MDAPDLREMVARAINSADNEWADAPRTMPHEAWPAHVADAVLAVPAIADALRAAERDAKVAEIVAGRDDCECDAGYPHSCAYELHYIAALYQADAVLAVPAIADALERDRKVAEIVANPEPGSYPSGMVKGYSRIAALYPETGK